MKIEPASDTTLIKLFVSILVLVLICAVHHWLGQREIARSLGHPARNRPKLIGVEGPMTKAEAELAAEQDHAPSVQSEGQSKESSLREEVKVAGA